MFQDPNALIEQTLENLSLLAEFFGDEVATLDRHGQQTQTLHRCREARNAIVSLLPKLRAAQAVQEVQYLGAGRCVNCE